MRLCTAQQCIYTGTAEARISGRRPLPRPVQVTTNRVVWAHGVHRASCRAWCGVCMVVAVSDLSVFLANAKGDRSIDAIADRATAAGHRIGRSVVAKHLRGEHGPRIPEATP